MLCYPYQLMGLLFAVSLSAAHASKESVYYSSTSLASPPYSTSSYETVSVVTVHDCSTEESKTGKHPHSKYSTATAPYSTGTSPQTKNSYTPTGSVFSTKSTTPVPSTTASTVSSTTSKIPPTCMPTSFLIQVRFQYNDQPHPIPINNSFISIVNAGSQDPTADISEILADPSQASTFHLNADCTLQYGTEFAALPPLVGDYTFSFYSPERIASEKYDKTTCQISGTELQCLAGTGTYYSDKIFYTCSAGPYFVTFAGAQRGYQDYCYALLLYVVPL